MRRVRNRGHTLVAGGLTLTLPLMSLFTSFFLKGMLACVKKLSRGQYKQVTAVRTEPGHPFQAG